MKVRILRATIVSTFIGWTLCAQTPSEPKDRSLVTYTSFAGSTYTLRQFNGLHTALLISDDSVAAADEDFIRKQIDRYDRVYDALKTFLGSEPSGDGLLRIAVLPDQGGAGFGVVGAKGCQITHFYFDDSYQHSQDALYEVVKHEMIHNFDRYSGFFFAPPDPGHSWTDFMQPYAGVYLREGYTGESSVAPDDWIRIMTDRIFGPYLAVPDHSWGACIESQKCDGAYLAQRAQGGFVLRVAQVYGTKAMKKWYPIVSELVSARGISASSLSDTEKTSFLVETLSGAVGEDLTCFADAIQWPVSSSVRGRLSAALPRSRYCADQDNDGYSTLQGDFNDNNPLIHPGAAEIVDGLDNDLNGAVDEVLIAETSPFPNDSEHALSVLWPVRITGTLTGETADDRHFFKLTVTATVNLRFQLKNTGNFKGQILVSRQDGSYYSSEYTERLNEITDLTLTFTPGDWGLSVTFGATGGPGTYELVVARAEPRIDSLLFAAPPVSQANGQIRLSVPSATQGVVSRSNRVGFWVTRIGWVGFVPIGADGSAALNWTPPAGIDISQLRYSIQHFRDDLPSSATSPPVPLVPSGCNFIVKPTSVSVPSAGGLGSLTVNSAAGCQWSAATDSPWLTLASENGGWGTGDGTVSVTIDPNVGPQPRTGTVTIAGQTTTINQAPVCAYSISPGGKAFLAAGGNGTIRVIAPTGCSWTASGAPAWATISSPVNSTGSGTIQFQVTANNGADRSGAITIANLVFTVEQASSIIAGGSNAGSITQMAAARGWKTTITLMNTGAGTAQARLNFFDNSGHPLPLPLYFPQSPPAAGPLLASTLDRTLTAGAVLVIESTGPDSDPLLVGWAQLLTNGTVGGFAIFTATATHQEAVVPLETRNAGSYLLPFDDTGGVATGLAIANVGTQPASVPVMIRDDTGKQIGNQAISLGVQQHTSFLLTPTYAATAGVRGTLEFDTPVGARISLLGLRANGAALTTLPVLASMTAGGGSMAQVASGGGWKTIFTLINADTNSTQATLSFLDNDGAPLALPLTFPQSGNSITAATVTQTLAPREVLVVEAQGPATQAVVVGSARLTTTGKVGGFAIFRDGRTGQEAVVPLETRNSNAYVLAFDNANGLATGLALANLSALAVNVPVVLRDDVGAVLGTPTISLAAGGHTSFLLTQNYAATAGKRGTVEFDTPAGGQISALGLRATPAGTLTTIPVVAK